MDKNLENIPEITSSILDGYLFCKYCNGNFQYKNSRLAEHLLLEKHLKSKKHLKAKAGIEEESSSTKQSSKTNDRTKSELTKKFVEMNEKENDQFINVVERNKLEEEENCNSDFENNTENDSPSTSKIPQNIIDTVFTAYKLGLRKEKIAKMFDIDISTLDKIKQLHGIKSRKRKLFPEDFDKVTSLFKKGKSRKEIAKIYGVHPTTISLFIKNSKNKIEGRVKRPKSPDSSDDEIDSEDLNITNKNDDILVEEQQFKILHSCFNNKGTQTMNTPAEYLSNLFKLKIYKLQQNMAQSRFHYKCPDCTFKLRKMHFIPIIYLIIDHFLDCKEHLVMENIRQIFLEESEAFKSFLGPNFNHFYKLPREAELTFYPKSRNSFKRCSLKIPEYQDDEFYDNLSFVEDDEEKMEFRNQKFWNILKFQKLRL